MSTLALSAAPTFPPAHQHVPIGRVDLPRTLDRPLFTGAPVGSVSGYSTLNRAIHYLAPREKQSDASYAVLQLKGRYYGFETEYFHEDIGPTRYEYGVTEPRARGFNFRNDAAVAVIANGRPVATR